MITVHVIQYVAVCWCVVATQVTQDKCREMSVVGVRRRGRGRKTWMECVEEDMHRLQLRSEDALDRGVWRNGILGKRPTRASAETQTLKRK